MGFEVLPWENDALDKYEVFEITSDSPWNPTQFREEAVTNFTQNSPNHVKTCQNRVKIRLPSL